MQITRTFENDVDRYTFDYVRCTYKKGWAQVDTREDASYFGTWCNPITFEIIQYAEGDVTHIKCEDAIEFANEVDDLCAFFTAKIDAGFGLSHDFEAIFCKLGMKHLLH